MEGNALTPILLKKGIVVDGSGAKPYQADVLLTGGRIAQIGQGLHAPEALCVDAAGKWVTPGFIHMHSHADCSAPMYPNMESTLGQGITTEFAGHCGLGIAPVRDNWLYMFPEKRAFTKVMPEPIGGINPYHFYTVPTALLRPAFAQAYGEELDWESYGEYIAHLRKYGIGANMALVAGQANIRLQAMGLDFKRGATDAEIAAMEESLTEAMDGGALGLSLGLDYQPGLYASHEELVRLMRLVAARDGIVTAHVRSRSHPSYEKEITYRDGLVEFLALGLETGAHIHVSHIQNCFDVSPENDALLRAGAEQTLALVDEYRKRGAYVTWDVIPTHAFGPFHYPMAASMFQPYVEQCGGVEAFARQLTIGNYRDVVENEIRVGNHASRGVFTAFNPKVNPAWDTARRFTKAADTSLVGKTIREAANGKDSLTFLLDLLSQDPTACVIPLGRRPEHTPDRDAFAAQAEASIGLDTWTFNYNAHLNSDEMPLECGSPSTYSGMTVFLKEQWNRPAEETIRKLTGNAATCIGLRDRGLLREGYSADVLVIDPLRFSPEECLADPRRGAQGLDYVIVNGEIAVQDGAHTHVRSGRIISQGIGVQHEI